MAATPKPPAQPAGKIYHPPGAPQPHPEHPVEKHEPEPVETVADEQRKRSDEIAAMGVEKYKESIDQRTEEEKHPHQVEGVSKKR